MQELMQDPDCTVSIYAYADGEKNRENYDLFEVSPVELGVEIQSERTFIGTAGWENPDYGYTPVVIERDAEEGGTGKKRKTVRAKIFNRDDTFLGVEDYGTAQDRYIDGSYAGGLDEFFQITGVLIRPDFIKGWFNSDQYFKVLEQTPGFTFWPDISEYVSGPVVPAAGLNYGAPVFNILSPNVTRS